MRTLQQPFLAYVVFPACVLVAGSVVITLRAEPAAPQAKSPPGVAVIELFTSEGCSSCPSAEAALADALKANAGKPVYALAFHVDYWDGLGWPDRFAAKAYTDRQRRYAAAMKLDNVYTPQAVVNGSHEFVGSNREALDAAIATGIATSAVGTLSANITSADDVLQLAITATKLPPQAIINAALVEDGLSTDVRRGENRGKTLPHERVVRAFGSTTLDAAGRASIPLDRPADVRADHASIVVFAQDPSDLNVLAAMEVKTSN